MSKNDMVTAQSSKAVEGNAHCMQQLCAAWLGLSRTKERTIVSLLPLRSATLCSTGYLHAART